VSPSRHHSNRLFSGHRSDVRAKRRREPVEEEDQEITTVKAQKLTEHEGRPRARDYDDVTQEFVIAAIGDYRAQLCAEGPMPDHTQETTFLNASWAKASQITGVNLVQTPQLAKLVSPILTALLCNFTVLYRLPSVALKYAASSRPSSAHL